MEVTLAALADYAATTDQGKLVVAGVFDTLNARRLPARHPMMALVLRLQAQPHEARSHAVAVRFVGPDGEEVLPELNARLDFPDAGAAERSTAQLVLNMPGVLLKQPGRHGIDVFVDGVQVASVPLWVNLVEAAEGHESGPAAPSGPEPPTIH
ncbi:MAG: hypothetical protein Kow0056_08240 [Coriobacteriia bacterium]